MFDNKAIMMSSDSKADLMKSLGEAMRAHHDSTDLFDEAAAAKLGINRTDLRCLSVIEQHGPVSVGDIGKAVGLTRGATTTALDRVERAGYARRVRHPSDRRGVLLEITPKAHDEAGAIWSPMVEESYVLMDAYSEADLGVILKFIELSTALQLRHLAVALGDPD